MFHKIRTRFSSAHLLAGLALFIALGGTAMAVKKNSVGSKQLKNNAVKASKIAANAVQTAKIANDAVTGEKVLESSLGKVPSAAAADTATTADTATSAGTAESAASATSADQLDGRGLQQVRPLADGVSDSTNQGLPAASFEATPLTEDIGIPLGGADLLVSASVELTNNAAGQAGAQCNLRSDGVVISQTYTITMPAGIASHNMSLTGFANDLPGTGALDPENVTVFCAGSISDDDIRYEEGDMTVQRIPVGAGA